MKMWMNRMIRMLSISVRFILENVFDIIILTHFHKSYYTNASGSIKIDSYWSGWICQCLQHTSDCDDGQCCFLGDVNKWNSTIACFVLMSEIQQRSAIVDLVVKMDAICYLTRFRMKCTISNWKELCLVWFCDECDWTETGMCKSVEMISMGMKILCKCIYRSDYKYVKSKSDVFSFYT